VYNLHFNTENVKTIEVLYVNASVTLGLISLGYRPNTHYMMVPEVFIYNSRYVYYIIVDIQTVYTYIF
jgi:hypothetical protein